MFKGESTNDIVAMLLITLTAVGWHLLTLDPLLKWDYGDAYIYLYSANNIFHPDMYEMDNYIPNGHIDGGQPIVPPLYPLIISVLIKLGFNNIVLALKVVNVFFAVSAGWLTYALFKRKLRDSLLYLLVSIVTLNAWVMYFKNAILVDLIYSNLILLFLLILDKKLFSNRWKVIIPGLVLSLIVQSKITGLFIYPFVIALICTKKINIKFGLTIIIISASSYLLTIPYNGYINTYLNTADANTSIELDLPGENDESLSNYVLLVKNRIHNMAGKLSGFTSSGLVTNNYERYFTQVTNIILIMLCFVHLLKQFPNKLGVFEWFFITYIALLFIAPSRMVSIRIVYPVILFMFYFAFSQLDCKGSINKYRKAMLSIMLTLLSVSVFFTIKANYTNGRNESYSSDTRLQNALGFIENSVNKDEIVLSRRPRGIVYFTSVKSSDYHINNYNQAFKEWAKTLNVRYILFDVTEYSEWKKVKEPSEEMDGALLNEYVNSFCKVDCNWIKVFENSRTSIYKFDKELL